MSDYKSNYKAMTAEQLSAEYQRLISSKSHRGDTAFSDKLKFLKDEFALKIKGLK